MLKFFVFSVLAVFLSYGSAVAQSLAKEQELARQILTALQDRSFKQNREFCGWIARGEDGSLVHSKVYRGKQAQCQSKRRLPAGAELIATFHTHGKYLPRFDNEVPSAIDVQNEQDRGTRGYVSTPGGRFWVIEGRTGVVRLICGPGCLPVDPGYRERPSDRIQEQYSAKQIRQRNNLGQIPKIRLCNGMLCTN